MPSHRFKTGLSTQFLPTDRAARTAILFAAVLAAVAAESTAFADEGLTEIVVTAQRLRENVQDVPLAVTAISGAELESGRVRQAGDIAQVVPSLVVSSPYGVESQPTFAIRGVTTNDFSENQGSPIAMYVDEVYKTVGAVQAVQIYDLERAEVLRGPQGTLYGKNATGGAINFYTRDPSLSDYDGNVTVSGGNYSSQSVRAAGGGPLIDGRLGVRAAVMYDKRDGWLKSTIPGVPGLNGVDARAGRLTLLYKPVDDLSMTLKVSSSRAGGTPYGVRLFDINASVAGYANTYGPLQNGAKYAVNKEIRNDDGTLKVDWQIAPHLNLASVTAFDYGRWYQKSDDGALGLDGSGTPIRVNDPNTYFSSVNAFSQELRIGSKDAGALGWLAGAYYGRDSLTATVEYHFGDQYQGYAGFSSPQGGALYGLDQYNKFDQIRVTRAAFLNLNFDIAPTLTLRAGARYTKDKITIENFYALGGGLASAPSGLAPDGGTTLWSQTISPLPNSLQEFTPGLAPKGPVMPAFSYDSSNTSAKVGLEWKPIRDVLLYASFSQGYRGAAFNGQAFNNVNELTFASPETVASTEIGFKSMLFERKVQLNAAAFHYAYHDQQFIQALNTDLGFTLQLLNAPRSRINGVEIEVRARPVPELELRGGVSFLDAVYQDLGLASGTPGNRLVSAPRSTVTATADWTIVTTAAGRFAASIDARYVAKQFFDAANTEAVAQPGYTITDARLGFEGSGATRWSIAAWIKNLADCHYIVYGLAQPSLGFNTSLLGEPRTYGLEFGYHF